MLLASPSLLAKIAISELFLGFKPLCLYRTVLEINQIGSSFRSRVKLVWIQSISLDIPNGKIELVASAPVDGNASATLFLTRIANSDRKSFAAAKHRCRTVALDADQLL